MKKQKLNAVHVSKQSEVARTQARPYKTKDDSRSTNASPVAGRGAAFCAEGGASPAPTRKKLWGARKRANEVDAKLVWKQFVDVLVPRLPLSTTDRAVYCHLVRHSHLEGKRRLRFSILWLARGTRLSLDSARQGVRRLIDQGALHLLERSRAGHVVEVRLPEEIRGARVKRVGAGTAVRLSRGDGPEETDFMQTRSLRAAIHAREGGVCFYCQRRVPQRVRCLDHVVPRAQKGRNGYRNLVSCCVECNSQKGERGAEEFFRQLYRDRRLTVAELTDRLCALDALAAGKLRPSLPAPAEPAAN